MKLCCCLAVFLCAANLRASVPMDDAIAAFQGGDLARAETILQRILQGTPRDAQALGLLGAVLDREQRFAAAEESYRKALQVEPRSATLLNNYANHQLAMGNVEAARVTYRKVVAIDPKRTNANLQLASLAVDRKQGAEALGYINRLPNEARGAPEVALLEMAAGFQTGQSASAEGILATLEPSAARDPRLAFSTGLALAKAARYADAERLFSKALQFAPSDFDVLSNLGLAAYHAGDLQRARDALGAARKAKPGDIDTLANLAAVATGLNHKEDALELLVEAQKIDPKRSDVLRSLAETASSLGYYADAYNAYGKYLAIVPNDVAASREHLFMAALTQDPRAGLAALQGFANAHPHDATTQYELGLLQAKSDPTAAAAHFQNALTIQPGFGPARLGRGTLAFLQGDYGAALADLQFAAQTYPDNATVLDRFGEELSALHRSDEAVAALQKASALAPGDARVLMHLSRALAKAGRRDESRAALAKFRAIGPQPGNLIPQAGLVEFLELPRSEQQKRYADQVERRLQETPDDPGLLARHLKVLAQTKSTADLSADIARYVRLNPPAAAADDVARAFLSCARYQEARTLLQYAQAASPSPSVSLDLALALLHTGGPVPAREQLNTIPSLTRGGDFYLAEAEILEAGGQTEDALLAAQKAIATAPARTDLYKAAILLLKDHGHPREALQLLGDSSKAGPDDPELLTLQAELLCSLRENQKAEQVLIRIHNRWPEWSPAYVDYGLLLEKQGRAKESQAELETAIGLGVLSSEIDAQRTRLGT